MKRLHRNPNAGFTLIEIMLVIIIVIALMAVLIPNVQVQMNRSRASNAQIYVTKLNGSLGQYELLNKRPPSTEQGLRALVEKPGGDPVPRMWSQLEAKIETDPWGTEYQYEFPGKHNPKSFDVFSCGPDRQPGTDDDIGNWDPPQGK
jgi:general secretion pathway protein G